MASLTTSGDTEHLGIPKAVFIDDVDSFMQQGENESVDTTIRRLVKTIKDFPLFNDYIIIFVDLMI